MAVVSGTIQSVSIVDGDAMDPICKALVVVSFAGTYAQADNAQVTAVPTAIQNSMRNGKTVSLVDAMLARAARKTSDPRLLIGAKTVAVSGADITMELTESSTANTLDVSTEMANGAVPAQTTNMHLLVSFTQA